MYRRGGRHIVKADAVTAQRAVQLMTNGRFMPMRDTGNGIQRKRQHQAGERYSQPG